MGEHELANLANKLSTEKLHHVLEETRLFDQMGVVLLQELASLHSPILVSDLPTGGQRDLQLLRLYQFEQHGFVESGMIRKGDSFIRKFHITNSGRKVAAALK